MTQYVLTEYQIKYTAFANIVINQFINKYKIMIFYAFIPTI